MKHIRVRNQYVEQGPSVFSMDKNLPGGRLTDQAIVPAWLDVFVEPNHFKTGH